MLENNNQRKKKRSVGAVVTEGSSILLDINHGDRFTFARANPSSMVRFGKVKCSLEPLVGCPFGSLFEVSKDYRSPHLVHIPQHQEKQSNDCEKSEVAGIEELDIWHDRDNRDLIDDNTAQSLSELEIRHMRRDGATGTEIVKALIANSASFQNKTVQSQEKYKRKKQKKYAPQIVVRCPSAQSICEAYFAKEPRKIGYLRMDMLALLLSLANVGANADVLILDELGGLLTAAVGERLGGFGTVCSAYCSSKCPSLAMLGLFNFTPFTSSSIFCAPLSELVEARMPLFSAEGFSSEKCHLSMETDVHATAPSEPALTALLHEQKISSARSLPDLKLVQQVEEGEPENCTRISVQVNAPTQDFSCSREASREIEFQDHCTANAKGIHLGKHNLVAEGCETTAIKMNVELQNHELQVEIMKSTGGIEDTDDTINIMECVGRKHDSQEYLSKAGRRASAEQIAYWGKYGFSSLVVGAPEMNPVSVCKQMLLLLSSSSPFVIYHPYMQPLADCMHYLRKERMAVNLQLSEPWLREYQILPSQTHPNMQMSSTTGFCLSGTRSIPS